MKKTQRTPQGVYLEYAKQKRKEAEKQEPEPVWLWLLVILLIPIFFIMAVLAGIAGAFKK